MEQLNVDKLKQIRSKLPFGTNKKIHQMTGLSRTLVSRVLNGKANNIKIIEAAYTIIEKENNKDAALKARHDTLIPQ